MANISYTKYGKNQYELSAYVGSGSNGYLFTRRYIDYTKDEATALFKQAIRLAK